ncbi:MAG: hypothetical protein MP439_09135 [Ferrimicrobium sp.]|nr:hypothetical protein [Ferrimicrobium sp.]
MALGSELFCQHTEPSLALLGLLHQFELSLLDGIEFRRENLEFVFDLGGLPVVTCPISRTHAA